MSTENQKYSLKNQMDAITVYAANHGIKIVKTYADVARSGLNLVGRPQLSRLLDDAQSGKAPFDVILVYDISRWGRFQDTDESAHYEFLCQKAGVSIRYCAEQFDDDGIASGMLKTFKRAMAAEYSRELSVKTFAGQCGVVQKGFWPGGQAPYGLRRAAIDESGTFKGQLVSGQQKNLRADRVILVPGPPEEIATVRRIFGTYVSDRRSPRSIAALLNREGVPVPHGIWRALRIRDMLRNEIYLGNLVYNRCSNKLGSKGKQNAPHAWVRRDGAFEATVDRQCFREAQILTAERACKRTNAEMLASLAALYKAKGRLSKDIINLSPEAPDASTYRQRFGSLKNAYALVGCTPAQNYGLRGNGRLRRVFNQLRCDIVDRIEASEAIAAPDFHPTLVRIEDHFVLRIAVVPARRGRNGKLVWRLKLQSALTYMFVLAARMDTSNKDILDYYLLPGHGLGGKSVTIGTEASHHEAFRMTSLKPLICLCLLRQKHQKLPEAAGELLDFLASV